MKKMILLTSRRLAPAAFLILFSAIVRGQDFSPSKYIGSGGSVARRDTLTATMRPVIWQVPIILGAPFSAEIHAERHQVLLDGTHIDQTAEPTRMWRDSAGRTRVEYSVIRYPVPPTRGFPNAIVIFDAAEKVQYVLDEERHIAHRYPVKTIAIPPVDLKNLEAAGHTDESHSEASHSTVTRVALGTQVVSGLVCQGQRTTIVLNPEPGNPGVTEVESWYSLDLQIEALYKTGDKGSMDNLRELRSVVRAEPDPALFQVPRGYTVVDEAGPFQITFVRH